MAVVPNGQKLLATCELFKSWKMLCATTAELQCHDLGPHRWPPQTAPADRPAVHHAAGTQSAVRCSGGGPDAHATSCVCGAARNTRFPCAKEAPTHRRVQHSRGPPLTASRAARRPEFLLRFVFCAQLHCLPLPFREHLPETRPAAEGHQNGQLTCTTLHTDDRAMRIPFFWLRSNQ